jgi:hypothetical protein
MVTIPKPVVPVGYNFFLIYIPMGIKYDPNPTSNRVFTHRVSVPIHIFIPEQPAIAPLPTLLYANSHHESTLVTLTFVNVLLVYACYIL